MRMRLLAPAVVYLGILTLSSLPSDDLSMLPSGLSWLGHAIEYAVLGAALRWALDDRSAATVITIVAVFALAGIDEAYQSTVPGRDPSALDWLVDVVAAAASARAYAHRRRAGAA